MMMTGSYDRRLCRAVGGHDDDRQLRIALAKPSQRFQAADAAHAHVHHHEVRLQSRNEFQSFFAAGSRRDFDLRRVENATKRILDVRFVIDEQQFVHLKPHSISGADLEENSENGSSRHALSLFRATNSWAPGG